MTIDTTVDPATAEGAAQRDALLQRVFEGLLAGAELLSIRLGSRLGLYEALAGAQLTPSQLAAATGIHERYAREWLEQQAVAGIVEVASDHDDAAQRCYTLPPGHAEALLDPDSPGFSAAFPQALAGLAGVLDAVERAYRHGGGVPYAAQGTDIRQGIGGINRPMFTNELGTSWLPSIRGLHDRLSADPPARILDLGCGTGWSSIAIACAYPNVRIDGIDLDAASIAEAQENARSRDVADRVRFEQRDAASLDAEARYNLVTVFEALHDMAHPVDVLRLVRAHLADDGALIVADERVADAFAAPGDEVERFMYAWSVLHCLPATRAEEPSVDGGAVLRTDTVRGYAEQAGFSRFEVLPIENDFWRFYRFRP